MMKKRHYASWNGFAEQRMRRMNLAGSETATPGPAPGMMQRLDKSEKAIDATYETDVCHTLLERLHIAYAGADMQHHQLLQRCNEFSSWILHNFKRRT
jgi:hypothetical protein